MNICPICGYTRLQMSPYDEHGYPSYEICDCCGFEYGFDDDSEGYSFENYREKWINEGFKFSNDKMQPETWNRQTMIKQLENVNKVKYNLR